jgi:excisionase family DNA binding protein
VAREFGVSIRTVDKWIHEKKIPFVKISERLIRFDLDEVDKAINRYTIREVA